MLEQLLADSESGAAGEADPAGCGRVGGCVSGCGWDCWDGVDGAEGALADGGGGGGGEARPCTKRGSRPQPGGSETEGRKPGRRPAAAAAAAAAEGGGCGECGGGSMRKKGPGGWKATPAGERNTEPAIS